MSKNTRGWTIALVVVAVLVILAIVYMQMQNAPAGPATGSTPPTPTTTTASYACSAGKTIAATYVDGASMPAATPDKPPTPGGSVRLVLSDGRSLMLNQTISADGARYANADESVVLWNKGNGVTFTEKGAQTFTGCIAVAADPGGLTQAYENGTKGFSIRYPSGYAVDEKYSYQALGPGKGIGGVKLTIPSASATGTNLSSDSYVSVEEIPNAKSCSAGLFLGQGATVKASDDNGTTYSVGTLSDAGAGNRYEETVYAMPGTNPCIAVRYFIHYSAIENYPAGAVQEFDKAALTAQFDAIRRTLTVQQ